MFHPSPVKQLASSIRVFVPAYTVDNVLLLLATTVLQVYAFSMDSFSLASPPPLPPPAPPLQDGKNLAVPVRSGPVKAVLLPARTGPLSFCAISR